MPRVSTSEVRQRFADTLNRVAYGRERIVLQRRGKDVAALIPVDDLAALEAMEDRLDVAAAKDALAESGERIPHEELWKELGL